MTSRKVLGKPSKTLQPQSSRPLCRLPGCGGACEGFPKLFPPVASLGTFQDTLEWMLIPTLTPAFSCTHLSLPLGKLDLIKDIFRQNTHTHRTVWQRTPPPSPKLALLLSQRGRSLRLVTPLMAPPEPAVHTSKAAAASPVSRGGHPREVPQAHRDWPNPSRQKCPLSPRLGEVPGGGPGPSGF